MIVVLDQTLASGSQARACEHMAQWLPRFTQVSIRRGLIRECYDLMQAQGSASASADTHIQGTAIDVAQTDEAVAAFARECGAPASWPRGPAYGQTFAPHSHLALDCPCPSNADYQIAAVKAGCNGLGVNGRGGRDYISRPSTWRDFDSGMAYMADLLQEDDMPTAQEIASAVWAHELTNQTGVAMGPSAACQWLMDGRIDAMLAAGHTQGLVDAIAARLPGVDTAAVKAAVKEALAESFTVEAQVVPR